MTDQHTTDQQRAGADRRPPVIPAPWIAVPILGVRDVRAVAEYWRDVFGFELDPVHGVFGDVADEAGGVYAIVSRNGCIVHFQIRRGPDPVHHREQIETDVYIHVDDVDAVYDDLTRRGANIWQPPALAPYGQNEIRVEDCVGHRLTFGSPADDH